MSLNIRFNHFVPFKAQTHYLFKCHSMCSKSSPLFQNVFSPQMIYLKRAQISELLGKNQNFRVDSLKSLQIYIPPLSCPLFVNVANRTSL